MNCEQRDLFYPRRAEHDMATQLFYIAITSVVTTALTLSAVWIAYRRHVKQRLWQAIDEKAEELSEMLESRVRQGVRDGIRDGVADLPADMVRQTRRNITETGFGIIEESVNTILGTPRRRKDK